YGSGLSSTGRIVNNIVVGNEATSLGGGVRLSNSSSVELVNNTIAANTGDGISVDASGATLTNNIVSHNTGYGIREEDSTADPTTVRNNDLFQNDLGLYLDEGTTTYTGLTLFEANVAEASDNLDADPQYVAGENDADHTDDDYRLLDSSPCLDAGHDGAEVPAEDVDDDVRPYDFAGVDNNGAALDFDIGADEFFIPTGDVTAPFFAGLQTATGAAGQICLDWEEADDPARPISYQIYRALSPGGQTFATPTATTYRTGYCDTTVEAETVYCYVVRAEDYVGNEDGNTVELCTTSVEVIVYVDAATGSDLSGDGSDLNPWRHLTFALTQVDAPAIIRVRPGTYDTTVDGEGFSEVFPILLKDGVQVISTDGAATTTLDAQGMARVVQAAGVGADTRFEGFTVTGGLVSGNGAGIWIDNSSLMVVANRITGNATAGSTSSELGGGIYVSGSSSAWILANEITGNTADGSNAGYGGGIAVNGSGAAGTRIESNTITGNSCGFASSVYGGGVFLGAGVELVGNQISGNTLIGSTRYGGGVFVSSEAQIEGNEILDNSGATYGGAIYGSSLAPVSRIVNNVLAGNDAATYGGGIRLTGNAAFPVVNNTIVYNQGDGISLNSSGTEIVGNILAFNNGYAIREETTTADPALVGHNDLFQNASGLYLDEATTTLFNLDLLHGYLPEATSNVEADPQFVSPEDDADHTDDDYHLQPTSPCIDAGSDDAFVPFDDIDGDARAFDAAGIDNNGP
ncbi:MAG: DUF1565 domain-containing protein, partial [bacterium]|nr:DUF1565 domain-containing protein [bacterium]